MWVLLPDLVVLDLSMQGMNGIDMISQILNRQTHPTVVIYSTYERCMSNNLMKTAEDLL